MSDHVMTTSPHPVLAKSKMYILVLETLPVCHAALACAHASLGGYLHFVEGERRKLADMSGKTSTELWASSSFRKVICSVTREQFQEAKSYGVAGEDYRVMTESSLDNDETAIVFCPRSEWEPFFRRLKLYGQVFPSNPSGTVREMTPGNDFVYPHDADLVLGTSTGEPPIP